MDSSLSAFTELSLMHLSRFDPSQESCVTTKAVSGAGQPQMLC